CFIGKIERRGDGAAERAGLENRRPRKGSASSNLAPSAIFLCNLRFFSRNCGCSVAKLTLGHHRNRCACQGVLQSGQLLQFLSPSLTGFEKRTWQNHSSCE